MLTMIAALIAGLIVLLWSADRFVASASGLASRLGLSPLLIGMIVVGFGTSAPEMTVSVLATWQGNPGIALGNAYGSNITNIALILGLTALLKPIAVQSQILRKELPVLLGITGLSVLLLWDDTITRADAIVLLAVFAALMGWTIYQGLHHKADHLGEEIDRELQDRAMPLGRAITWLVVGLVLLIASSRMLVWGAVEIAQAMGVSDLVIGLTVIAVGTSLPELAASIIATRKGEHDIALGNILGSNMFNTLAVVGIAGSIAPMSVPAEVMSRDVLTMSLLTISLFVFGYRAGGPGRINRVEGALLLASYVAYTTYLIRTVFLP